MLCITLRLLTVVSKSFPFQLVRVWFDLVAAALASIGLPFIVDLLVPRATPYPSVFG